MKDQDSKIPVRPLPADYVQRMRELSFEMLAQSTKEQREAYISFSLLRDATGIASITAAEITAFHNKHQAAIAAAIRQIIEERDSAEGTKLDPQLRARLLG